MVILKPYLKGGYEVIWVRLQAGAIPGAKNLDSYRSTAEFYETFDRFENFPFLGLWECSQSKSYYPEVGPEFQLKIV